MDKLKDKKWLEAEVAKLPVRHIAKNLGVPYSRAYTAVKRFGIKIPMRNGYIFTEESRKAKSIAQKAAYKKKYPEGRFGDSSPRWQGGRHKQKSGYVIVYAPGHPRSGRYNRTFEHIVVAEKTIGRYLTKDEVVHHLNGDKQDNRPENLEVLLRKDHVHAHHMKGTRITALHDEIKRLQSILDEHNIKY